MKKAKKNELPPKILTLIKSEHKDTVDQMLDNGLSFKKVKVYLDSKGFNISINYVSRYNKYRKGINVEEQNLDKFMGKSSISKVVIDGTLSSKGDLTTSDKLKNDLEFLDTVIQTGAENLRVQIENNQAEITIDNVFDAIKIKDKITDGALAGMTSFGIENLTQMTEEKYMKLIKHMFRYIPQEDQKKLLKELDIVEEDFYKETDYYEDYLRSQGYTDKQIKDKMKK